MQVVQNLLRLCIFRPQARCLLGVNKRVLDLAIFGQQLRQTLVRLGKFGVCLCRLAKCLNRPLAIALLEQTQAKIVKSQMTPGMTPVTPVTGTFVKAFQRSPPQADRFTPERLCDFFCSEMRRIAESSGDRFRLGIACRTGISDGVTKKRATIWSPVSNILSVVLDHSRCQRLLFALATGDGHADCTDAQHRQG